MSVQQVRLWCVCGIVWGSECPAGGFMVVWENLGE